MGCHALLQGIYPAQGLFHNSESRSVVSNSLRPQRNFSGESPSPGNLPNPGIEPRSPTLQADSLPAEPQEKPKITGVGSLSLLQQIFPTQELNQGLLHCRQTLYQLSYEGSPMRDATTMRSLCTARVAPAFRTRESPCTATKTQGRQN